MSRASMTPRSVGRLRRKSSRQNRRMFIEALESRCVLSATGAAWEIDVAESFMIIDDWAWRDLPLEIQEGDVAVAEGFQGPADNASLELLNKALSNPKQAVKLLVSATDMQGNPLDHVEVGDTFLLNVEVEDVRMDPQGVFSMYFDLLYDPALMEVVGEIDHSDIYQSMPMGNLSQPGIVNDSGGFSGSLKPVGAGVLPLYTIPMRAIAAGTALIAGDPADCKPVTDVGVYGQDAPVAEEQVEYGQTTLQIGSGGKSQMTASELAALSTDSCVQNIKLVPPVEPNWVDDIPWLAERDPTGDLVAGFIAVHLQMDRDTLVGGPGNDLFQVLWLSDSDSNSVSTTLSESAPIPLISSASEQLNALPVDSVMSEYTEPSDNEATDLESLDEVFAQLGELDLAFE